MSDRKQGMNRELEERCEALRELLERANADEVATRYQAGVIVAEVRDSKGTFGDRGVELLAEALKKHRGTLYRYAAVADLGPWKVLQPFVEQKNPDGEPLSWSHWLELARARSAWKGWHARALNGCWSVRELSGHLDLALGTQVRDEEAADTTAGAFVETMRAIERFEIQVTGALDAILDRIERDPFRERPRELPELLARATDLMEVTHDKTGSLLARMRKLRLESETSLVAARKVGPAKIKGTG